MTHFIDRSKYDLVGYTVYYSNGFMSYYENIEDVDSFCLGDPLVEIKEVGELKKRKIGVINYYPRNNDIELTITKTYPEGTRIYSRKEGKGGKARKRSSYNNKK